MRSPLGSILKTERKKKNMTQSELAKKLGKSLRTIQKYESGEITPPLEVIFELSEILEITFYNLMQALKLDFWEIPNLSDVTKKYAWDLLGIDKELFLERCESPFEKSLFEDRLGMKYISDSIEAAKKELGIGFKSDIQVIEKKVTDKFEDDPFLILSLHREVSDDMNSLNILGQKKAVEMIKLLTKIPEYQDNYKEGD